MKTQNKKLLFIEFVQKWRKEILHNSDIVLQERSVSFQSGSKERHFFLGGGMEIDTRKSKAPPAKDTLSNVAKSIVNLFGVRKKATIRG